MSEGAPRRRLNAAWVLALGLLVFIVARELPSPRSAAAVYCDEHQPPAAGQVTMLSASWCTYCTQTRNWLVARGVSYCEYDIERSPTGIARYQASDLKVIPQIFIGDRLLVGFNADELEQTLAAHDLLPMPGGED